MQTIFTVLPTTWRQKPAGIDKKRIYVTVVPCIEVYCFWFYGEHHTSCIIDAQFCSVRHKITSQSLIRTVKLSYCLLNVYRISIVLKRESLERANASALNGSSGHLIYSDCGSPEDHRSTAGNHKRPQASWTLSVMLNFTFKSNQIKLIEQKLAAHGKANLGPYSDIWSLIDS